MESMIIQGDSLIVLKSLPSESVHCVITSPPYWGLRDYGVSGQLGLENTPEEYVANMVHVFAEVKRVLKKDGTLWLNLGDSYGSGNRKTLPPQSIAGHYRNEPGQANDRGKQGYAKQLIGIPWRVAFALQADGWYLRQDIIWHKTNPMPESVKDRCTKAHEYVFLMSKSERYYFDNEAIREPIKKTTNGTVSVRASGDTKKRDKAHWGIPHEGRGNVTRVFDVIKGANKRSVWSVPTRPFRGAHFATFPEALIEPMVKAGCPRGGIVLDPFSGAGTTCVVSKKLGRKYLGIELNPEYIKISNDRINKILL